MRESMAIQLATALAFAQDKLYCDALVDFCLSPLLRFR
jgi:hypothetical protein